MFSSSVQKNRFRFFLFYQQAVMRWYQGFRGIAFIFHSAVAGKRRTCVLKPAVINTFGAIVNLENCTPLLYLFCKYFH